MPADAVVVSLQNGVGNATVSRRIVELIRQAERDAGGSPGLTPAQVRAAN